MNDTAYPDSDRLRYRLMSAEDEALYCDLYASPEVMKFVASPLSREQAQRGFKKALALQQEPFGCRFTTIIERATDNPVGISVIKLVDATKRRAEVGSMLLPEAQAKGYGPEYSAALIDYAFKHRGVEEMSAQVVEGNTANETLLSKLGFLRSATVVESGGASRRSWTTTRTAWSSKP